MIEKRDGCLYMDGYDDCLVGHVVRYGQETIALYSIEKLVWYMKQRQGMSREEALEYIYFNQIGAWVGELTPCFLDPED